VHCALSARAAYDAAKFPRNFTICREITPKIANVLNIAVIYLITGNEILWNFGSFLTLGA